MATVGCSGAGLFSPPDIAITATTAIAATAAPPTAISRMPRLPPWRFMPEPNDAIGSNGADLSMRCESKSG